MAVIGKGASVGIDIHHFKFNENLKDKGLEIRRNNKIPDYAKVFLFLG